MFFEFSDINLGDTIEAYTKDWAILYILAVWILVFILAEILFSEKFKSLKNARKLSFE
jgi:hypothetical protein